MEEESTAEKAVDAVSNTLRLGDPIGRMLKQLNEIWFGFVESVPQIVVAILILVVAVFVSRGVRWLIGRATNRAKLRPSLRSFFQLVGGLATWVLGLMIAAVVVFPNLTPASMIAGLGIGTVAIGFAFKDIFENFLAGIFILLRKEMRIGDFIQCEEIEGKVENIVIRESHIRQTDGQLVIVPNSYLFKNPLTIRTDLTQRRTTVVCGVAYSEDVDASREIIREAVEGCESVITDKQPVQIFAQEFADSAINFEVTWWTGSKPVDIRSSRDQVVAAVKRALDDAGIEIPFPYRTLTFKEPLSLTKVNGDAGG